jgi:hypothetical protein
MEEKCTLNWSVERKTYRAKPAFPTPHLPSQILKICATFQETLPLLQPDHWYDEIPSSFHPALLRLGLDEISTKSTLTPFFYLIFAFFKIIVYHYHIFLHISSKKIFFYDNSMLDGVAYFSLKPFSFVKS